LKPEHDRVTVTAVGLPSKDFDLHPVLMYDKRVEVQASDIRWTGDARCHREAYRLGAQLLQCEVCVAVLVVPMTDQLEDVPILVSCRDRGRFVRTDLQSFYDLGERVKPRVRLQRSSNTSTG
jgi:hypothetical protein